MDHTVPNKIVKPRWSGELQTVKQKGIYDPELWEAYCLINICTQYRLMHNIVYANAGFTHSHFILNLLSL